MKTKFKIQYILAFLLTVIVFNLSNSYALTNKDVLKVSEISDTKFLCLYYVNGTKLAQTRNDGSLVFYDINKKLDTFKKKRDKTNLERYGNIHTVRAESVIKKIKATMMERYGSDKNSGIQKRCMFDNEYFDSSWELAFWIYFKDKKFNISRCKDAINYNDGEKDRYYIPDFIVDGQLYEIKGNQFFDKDGNLINPYDKTRNNTAIAKQECMKKHNVIVIRKKRNKVLFKLYHYYIWERLY